MCWFLFCFFRRTHVTQRAPAAVVTRSNTVSIDNIIYYYMDRARLLGITERKKTIFLLVFGDGFFFTAPQTGPPSILYIYIYTVPMYIYIGTAHTLLPRYCFNFFFPPVKT